MVRQNDGTRQREKADRLRREFSQLGVLMRGSLVHSRGKCGKANCRCARGQLHEWWSLTFRAGGKSRSVTVPPELLGEVRQWCGNYQKLKGLVVELSDVLVAVIRAERAALRARPGQGDASSSGGKSPRHGPSARAGGKPSREP